MRSYIRRILAESKLTSAQWAILSAASYFLPFPLEQFVIEAQLESEDNFSKDELMDALDECLHRGWISQADSTRFDQLDAEFDSGMTDHLENGIVLTDDGQRLKEKVGLALFETIELP